MDRFRRLMSNLRMVDLEVDSSFEGQDLGQEVTEDLYWMNRGVELNYLPVRRKFGLDLADLRKGHSKVLAEK